MVIETPQRSSVIFGFDSAWTDRPKAPGAICAIAFDEAGEARFSEPALVSFAEAADYIRAGSAGYDFSLVALDQPTVVPNTAGSRPVDKIAASLISYVGGGVQPANRGKTGMFCDASPIWRFLATLGAVEDPLAARTASSGRYLMEVFPALALPALHEGFAARLKGAKYNPQNRRTYRADDWKTVADTVATCAGAFGLGDMEAWARATGALPAPRKADQDKLDAAICALIGVIWRAGPASAAEMFGDLQTGYMVTPVSAATGARLRSAAGRVGGATAA
jgi:Uncharacterized protein conserved in bacteria